MAGKSNTSATFFAQKKLLGKAHTSNLKTDGEELIGSNIQSSTNLLFGQPIPISPSMTLNLIESSSQGAPGTIEYIQFALEVLTGSTYDADNSGGGGGADSGETSQSSGPHTYKFKLPSDYISNSSNNKKGNGVFNNNKIVHETLGGIQLVPPFYSQTAPNPYIIKIYKDDGSGNAGSEIPLLDNIDWNVDYYNGMLFLQDYDANKIPAHARAFAYIGDYANQGFFEISLSGSLQKLTDGSSYLIAGDNITITSGSNGQITISSTATSSGGSGGGTKSKKAYTVTDTITSGSSFTTTNSAYDDAGFSPSLIDVFLNGQLLLSGTNSEVGNGSVDYFVSDSNKLKFGFDLNIEDVINVVVENSGSAGADVNPGGTDTQVQFNDGGNLAGDSGLVFNKTTNSLTTTNLSGSLTKLSDGTSYIKSSTGINIVSSSNGAISIKVNKEMIFNELLGGSVDGFNTLFTLANTPFASNEISIFVNGQLQTPPGLATFQDYSVTGSNVFFTTGSTPEESSLVMAMYNKVVS